MSKLARYIILLLLVIFAGWMLYPTLNWYFFVSNDQKELLRLSAVEIDALDDAQKQEITKLKNIRNSSISLGLDLQGGVYIVSEVDDKDLYKQLMEQNEYDEDLVNQIFEQEKRKATTQTIGVLKNRMDRFGVSEPSIRATYDNRIAIELPGLSEPNMVKDALSQVGKIEFYIVDEISMKKLSYLTAGTGYISSKENLPDNFVLPSDSIWLPYYENDEWDVPQLKGWYILKSTIEMDGTALQGVRADKDQFGRNYISFTLNSEGTDIFAELTRNNVNKRIAIVLDGNVKSAPVVQQEIVGQGQITGNFTDAEALYLEGVLKAGSLPLKINVLEEKVIGPTLGADSIQKGLNALLFGAALVIVFMICYYRTAGVIATIDVLFNLFFLTALLAMSGATLTLSGIAGIALTVGMAVDANVIIYERIREELRLGKTFSLAFNNGYNVARTTIWDSNLTTLLAAIALNVFGTGTIKGFGLTLTFGIIANIFVSLFITRLLVDTLLETFNCKKIHI